MEIVVETIGITKINVFISKVQLEFFFSFINRIVRKILILENSNFPVN